MGRIIILFVTLLSILAGQGAYGASKTSWKPLKGKTSKLSKLDAILALPGKPRVLEGEGELFPEISDGFVFRVEGEILKISKKGSGKPDSSLKKDFEAVTFTLPYPGERKGKYCAAFTRKNGVWTVQSATIAALKTPFGELTIYDADVNGRFDDPGADIVKGIGDTPLPLTFFLSIEKFRGLLHIWASGTRGALWPLSEKAKKEWMEGMSAANRIRGRGGLAPLGLDEGMCFALISHAEYLIKNGLKKTEEQSPGMPGYTPEGARAGKNVISFFGTKVTDFRDQLMREFRDPLIGVSFIHPELERIGFCSHGTDSGAFYLCNVDLGLKKKEIRRIVTYPFSGQTEVPCFGSGKKVREALKGKKEFGHPIYVLFPEHALPKNVGVRLKDATGRDIPFHLFTPENPVDSEEYPTNKDAVFIVPKAELNAETWYQAGISWEVRKKILKRTWRFKTGKQTESNKR
jgi:hypothetical protein